MCSSHQHKGLAELKKKLDSLKKMRKQAEANDFHVAKRSLEDDVFASEDFFSEE